MFQPKVLHNVTKCLQPNSYRDCFSLYIYQDNSPTKPPTP